MKRDFIAFSATKMDRFSLPAT